MITLRHEVQLLDVTLRDGGFVNDFNFSSEVVNHVISELDKTGVGHIEVGFRNGIMNGILPGMGIEGICPKEYLNHCKKLIHSAKLTVMCFAKNMQPSDYKEMQDCGVNSVRMCLASEHDLSLNIKAIEMAKNCGFEVFVNIVFISQLNIKTVHSLVLEIAQHTPQAIYLADSAGHLTPDKIGHIFSTVSQHCNSAFGFHGHDNLFLAQANALSAISHGVTYIDATLAGIGRGVGNLRMEGIVSLLRAQGCTKYNVPKILNLAEYVHSVVLGEKKQLPLNAMISGIFNCSEHDLAHIDPNTTIENYFIAVQEYAKKNGRF